MKRLSLFSRSALWLAIAGLGASAMFLFDPAGGRRRRALLRDKFLSQMHDLWCLLRGESKNLRRRIAGSIVEARATVGEREVPADVMVSRVRAELGHAVSNAGSLDILVEDGRVVVSGSVIPGELRKLEGRLRHVRGLRDWELRVTEKDGATAAREAQSQTR